MKQMFMLTVALMTLALALAPAQAYLRLHPDNPRYLQETTTGKAVVLAGCASIVPSSKNYNHAAQIEEMAQKGVNYSRVWHFLPWEGEDAIWPWAESSTPGGHWGGRGGNKLDMDKWNPDYWSRMRDAMDKASKAGVYAEIHMFDRCGISPASNSRWGGNPWASDHNINDLETPASSGDGTPDFYLYKEKPNLRKQQERYVRKMIDETIAYNAVIYEVENEHWKLSDPDFGRYYAKLIKDYIAQKYADSPRLVSYNSLNNDLEAFYSISEVDIVNKHLGANKGDWVELNDYIESRWDKKKAINIDEFANGTSDPAVLRKMCWTIVASGGHFHIEDPASSAKPFDVCGNINKFVKQSEWDFVHAKPNRKLVSPEPAYCMANPGKEYVAYFIEGGEKQIELAAGRYVAKWWNTVDGGFGKVTEFSHSGGTKTLTTPDAGDWVLWVKAP